MAYTRNIQTPVHSVPNPESVVAASFSTTKITNNISEVITGLESGLDEKIEKVKYDLEIQISEVNASTSQGIEKNAEQLKDKLSKADSKSTSRLVLGNLTVAVENKLSDTKTLLTRKIDKVTAKITEDVNALKRSVANFTQSRTNELQELKLKMRNELENATSSLESQISNVKTVLHRELESKSANLEDFISNYEDTKNELIENATRYTKEQCSRLAVTFQQKIENVSALHEKELATLEGNLQYAIENATTESKRHTDLSVRHEIENVTALQKEKLMKLEESIRSKIANDVADSQADLANFLNNSLRNMSYLSGNFVKETTQKDKKRLNVDNENTNLGEILSNLTAQLRKELTDSLTEVNEAIRLNEQKVTDLCRVFRASIPEEGWVNMPNGYQYKVIPRHTWQQSNESCTRQGGHLATVGIRDGEIRHQLKNRFHQTAWIGVTDLDEEGRWMFIDGVAVTKENVGWGRGEPNDSGNNEDCATLSSSHTNDLRCSYKNEGLCEKRIRYNIDC
ncbi:unnamed protein product [Clavelina lepadiformis]|uniref:C-type lectin domain-containing protein n=1 Tax=Clavelina lepadiformis TaxID=159417 RepID=A0ABP0GS04_CLALP